MPPPAPSPPHVRASGSTFADARGVNFSVLPKLFEANAWVADGARDAIGSLCSGELWDGYRLMMSQYDSGFPIAHSHLIERLNELAIAHAFMSQFFTEVRALVDAHSPELSRTIDGSGHSRLTRRFPRPEPKETE